MQSFTKLTLLPSFSSKYFATGSNENSFSKPSPFGLPKWVAIVTFAPCSIMYFTVGRVLTILSSLSTLPSFIGTFKSALSRTFLPFKSQSFNVFKFILSPLCFSWLCIIFFAKAYIFYNIIYKKCFKKSPFFLGKNQQVVLQALVRLTFKII